MSTHKSEDFKISAVNYYLDSNKTQEEVCDRYCITISTNLLIKKLANPEQQISNTIIDDCMICLEQSDYMIQLECRHIYCCVCLKYYLELEKTKCGYCQKVIDKNSDKHMIYKINIKVI
jgi:hypothetical protein